MSTLRTEENKKDVTWQNVISMLSPTQKDGLSNQKVGNAPRPSIEPRERRLPVDERLHRTRRRSFLSMAVMVESGHEIRMALIHFPQGDRKVSVI